MLHTPETRRKLFVPLITLLLACACAWGLPSAANAPRVAATAEPVLAAIESEKSVPAEPSAECGADSYGRLPLRFEPNQGQTDERVRFLSRLGNYDLFLTPVEAVFALQSRKASVLRMRLAGANAGSRGEGRDSLPGVSNYLKGNDPSRWLTNVPHFARVQFEEIYRGIDLVYYGNGAQLEYDFRLAPGADPRLISMEFEGTRRPRLDARGDLLLPTTDGEVRLLKPVAYQETKEGERVEVAARFVVHGRRVTFRLGAYDASRALVIDPCVMYATFLGGGLDDRGLGIGADSQGHAYVAGLTTSLNFPVTGNPPPAIKGPSDAFVAKLSPDGTSLVWATYFGGSGTEDARDIAVDAQGNAYITGITDSFDLPTLNAFQPTKGSTNGFIDAYVTKLTTAGTLAYSTYLGGWRPDLGEAIAVDAFGSAYVTGSTGSNDTGNLTLRPFPITQGAYQSNFPSLNAGGGNSAVFVTKLAPTGALDYSTFLGGLGNPSGSTAGDGNPDDLGYGIAVDSVGCAYVAGRTESERFPTTPGAVQATYGGGLSDAFFSKLNPSGTALDYSTFLGGSKEENRTVGAVTVDPAGNVYVAGGTDSTNFPVLNALQPSYGGNPETEAYLAKLDPSGGFVYSTYLGANNFKRVTGVAADDTGVAYVTGTNTLRRISANGSAIVPTWVPGGEGRNVVLDQQGNIYVSGITTTSASNKCTTGNFCPTPGALQPNPGGSTTDAFVMKFRGDRQPLKLAGYTFDADAAIDDVTLLSTPLAGGQPCSAVSYTGTTTRERVRDALADACPATSTLGQAKFETHFNNNRLVNLPGPDLVVFEIGGGTGNEPFTLEVFDPATGGFTAPQTITPLPTSYNDCANLRINAAEIDLDDFGIAEGAFISRLRFDNLWVANVNSSGADISDVLALHSTGLNNPPVADAGPDQTLRESNGAASFTLDGSVSSDPDGDALSFVWRDMAGNVAGNAAQITLSRPPGAYVFTLTVDDGRGGTDTDSVEILINSTAGLQPVVFTNAADFDEQASEQITFDPLDERTAQAVASKFDALSSFTIAGGQAAIRHTSEHATNFAGEGTEGGPVSGEYRIDWGYAAESVVTVTFATPVDSVGAYFGGVSSSGTNLTVTFEDGSTLAKSLLSYLPAVPNGSTQCNAINGFLGVDSNGGPRIVSARFSVTRDAASLDSIYFGQALGGSRGPGPTRFAESPFGADCETVVTPIPWITSGLPDGAHIGPGTPGQPGRVIFPITGTGTPGCTIRATVEDHRHVVVGVFTTTVAADGTWSLLLDIEDCDVTIRLVQICDGVESEELTRRAYVDGTPPVFTGGGLVNEVNYVGGGGATTATVILNGGARDENTSHCVGCGSLLYEWYLIGGGGTRTLLGGGSGTLLDLGGGPGSGLRIELEPGEYVFEVVVTDEFGNQTVSRCVRRVVVAQLVTITGGLPADRGFYGPGTPGTPGRVRRTISGTGNPDCSINITVSDPTHPHSSPNNQAYTTTVDADGNWALDLELEDCHPFVQVVQVCGGVPGDAITRQIYVDGTPPSFTGGGIVDGIDYITGGGSFTLTLDASASDPDTYHCEGNCGGLLYEWYLIGGGGSRTRLGVGGGGTLLNLDGGPGSGLRIVLAPGVYEFEVVVRDPAGNLLVQHCVRRVLRPLTITGGLPGDGGIYGPGTPGQPGTVTRTVTGTGEPGCTVNVAVSDPHHPDNTRNNQTYTTSVDADGNWSLVLTLDDCHPLVVVSQSCEDDGDGGGSITRRIYVDGTPAVFTSGGLADRDLYVGSGGTGQIVLDGGASDAGSHVPGNALAYEWYAVGGDGSRTPLCTNCPGALTLERPLGDYDFELVVTDTAGNRATDACHVRVLKRPTTIECEGLTVDFAGLAALSSTLRDALTGEVLEGRAVTYKVAGVPVPNPFEAYLLPGAYPVEASFEGDDFYQPSAGAGDCLLVVRSTPGKITGGGSVDEGLRNFGFIVQTKSRGGATIYTGSLEFQDKSKGYNLHSQSISVIAVSADRLRGVFTGTATLNRQAGYTFKVWVDDLGEPGAGVDKFRVEINGPEGFHYDSSAYATLGGKLDQGGNIQIHKSN